MNAAASAATNVASTVHQNELMLYFVLLQLVIIVLASRITVGEIVVGNLPGVISPRMSTMPGAGRGEPAELAHEVA